MTDLTEQWKKGELPSGYYYVKNEFDNIFPSEYSEDYDYIGDTVIKDFFTEVSEIKEVLDQVPSYEEWKSAQEQLQKDGVWYTEISHKKVLRDNKQLKELLKECRQWFDWYHIDTETGKEYIESWHKKGHEIHQRINQVLGEE